MIGNNAERQAHHAGLSRLVALLFCYGVGPSLHTSNGHTPNLVVLHHFGYAIVSAQQNQISRPFHSPSAVNELHLPSSAGCGSKPMVSFWGRCTTHFRTYFRGDWDVHRGCRILTHGLLCLEQTFGPRGAHWFKKALGRCPASLRRPNACESPRGVCTGNNPLRRFVNDTLLVLEEAEDWSKLWCHLQQVEVMHLHPAKHFAPARMCGLMGMSQHEVAF